jgi:hypothetical protein
VADNTTITMRIAFYILFLFTFSQLGATDIGILFISSSREISIKIEDGDPTKLTVTEVVEFTPNRYYESATQLEGFCSLAVRTSCIELIDVSPHSASLLAEPRISLSVGKCTGMSASQLNRFRYLFDVDLGVKSPPPTIHVVIEYTASIEKKPPGWGIRITPYIHNADFIPPIMFQMKNYRVRIDASRERAITALLDGKVTKDGTTEIVLEKPSEVEFLISDKKNEPTAPSK